MTNPFDQFDTVAQANPFDQFDEVAPQQPPQQFYNEDVPRSVGDPFPQDPNQPIKPESSFGDYAEGLGETALTLGTGATTGALGFAIGTVEGAIGELLGNIERGQGVEVAKRYADALTNTPETPEGMAMVKAIGDKLGALPPVLGTPALGTVAAVGSNALTKLKASIPNRSIPKNIMKTSSGKKALLKREIAEGNPNIDTITKALNSEGDIVTNKASKSALNTIGDNTTNRELISVLERLDPASKKQVSKMLDNIVQKKKFPDSDARPSHVMGESIGNRARAIAIKNEQAGKRIGSIASSLKNKDVNIQTPVNDFFNSLTDLGVTYKTGDDGWITPDFSRSKFVGGNQKDMTVLINDLASGDINFHQAHKLKQTIRDNVDFDKGGAGQIKGDSQKLLRDLSSGIDSVLDGQSSAYKKANDTFAKTVKLKDDWQKNAGKDIDLFDDISPESLALKGRRMSSNAASGPEFKKLMTDTDAVLKDLGVNFKDKVHSLNFVVNKLDDLFKVTPETSMQGVIERGVDASFSPVAAAKQGIETVKGALSPNDAKKIASLKELMKTK